MSTHGQAAAELCSIWLLPRAEDAAALAAVIDALAARFGAPGFAPHLTLLADLRLPPERVRATLARTSPPKLRLDTRGVAHSPRRFESLTVGFFASEPLSALRTRLADELRCDAAGPWRPHLSLFYPSTPLEESLRQGLCDEVLTDLAPAYGFDGLCAVRPSPPGQDWHDVAGWTLL